MPAAGSEAGRKFLDFDPSPAKPTPSVAFLASTNNQRNIKTRKTSTSLAGFPTGHFVDGCDSNKARRGLLETKTNVQLQASL